MKKILKKLKKKITMFTVVMLALQPVLAMSALPAHAITTVYGASVTSFTLVNADTDTDIGPLTDGMVINLESEDHLNVRANTSPATVGSVKFGLDANANYRNETAAPYALNGDAAGNYIIWTPSVGVHTVTATPKSEAGGNGDSGTPLTVTFTVIDSPILTEVTPVVTPTKDNTPAYTFSSTRAGTIVYGGDCTGVTTEAVAGNNLISFGPLTDDTYSNCTITVIDEDANVSLPLSVTAFEVDTTGPDFDWTVNPSVAGPAAPVTIEITTNEPLKPMTGLPTIILVGGKEAHVLDATSCTSYDILLTVKDPANPYQVCLNKDSEGKYKHVYSIGDYVGPEKTIPFTIIGQDQLENMTTDETGSFKASNVNVSPVVETPVVTPAVAVVTTNTPAPTIQDDQYGGTYEGGSDGGEVKADTTAQEENKDENKDDNQEDVKEKKNIPLWGIIFLLLLAGIGGYLFYSQNPEKPNGKK